MNFDKFYCKENKYFSQNQSDGMQSFLEKYNLHQGNALDIGAGEGRNSVFLSKIGFNVVAIEPSKEGCKKIVDEINKNKLNIQVENLEFLQYDTTMKFDFIVALTSLSHMDYNKIDDTIKKIYNLLNTNGYIYVVDFTEDDPGYLKDVKNSSECAMYVNHYFKKNELKQLFENFEILYYNEYTKEDNTHGKPHYHGKVKLFARKLQ